MSRVNSKMRPGVRVLKVSPSHFSDMEARRRCHPSFHISEHHGSHMLFCLLIPGILRSFQRFSPELLLGTPHCMFNEGASNVKDSFANASPLQAHWEACGIHYRNFFFFYKKAESVASVKRKRVPSSLLACTHQGNFSISNSQREGDICIYICSCSHRVLSTIHPRGIIQLSSGTNSEKNADVELNIIEAVLSGWQETSWDLSHHAHLGMLHLGVLRARQGVRADGDGGWSRVFLLLFQFCVTLN